MKGAQRARIGAYLYVFLREAAQGNEWVSSAEIARLTGVTDSFVRRDLIAEVGSIGKRGSGYKVARMIRALAGREITGAALLLAGSPLALTDHGDPFFRDAEVVRLALRASEIDVAIADAAQNHLTLTTEE